MFAKFFIFIVQYLFLHGSWKIFSLLLSCFFPRTLNSFYMVSLAVFNNMQEWVLQIKYAWGNKSSEKILPETSYFTFQSYEMYSGNFPSENAIVIRG